MPRQAKKTNNRTPGETVPRQFRLKSETLADLDEIAEHLTRTTGIAASRTDALRYAARQTADSLPQKKTSRKSSNSG
jgi:hypothetical protein